MSEANPPPWSNANISYDERIVAFFDVLGWKDIVDRAGDDPSRLGEIRSLVGLYGYFQQQIRGCAQGAALTAFSDNVVASMLYEAGSLQAFIDTIGRYQFAAATNGFFLRGGVTVGRLFHDETSVFGPALARAYHLESQQAIYPRVI